MESSPLSKTFQWLVSWSTYNFELYCKHLQDKTNMEAKNINSSILQKPNISLESTELDKSSNVEKIICILVWLIIEIKGTFMIVGIIQYEWLVVIL